MSDLAPVVPDVPLTPPTPVASSVAEEAPTPQSPTKKKRKRQRPFEIQARAVMKRIDEKKLDAYIQIKNLIRRQGLTWVEDRISFTERMFEAAVDTACFRADGTKRTKGGAFFEVVRRSLLAAGFSKMEVRKMTKRGGFSKKMAENPSAPSSPAPSDCVSPPS